MSARPAITGLIVAGGLARRMGGLAKGLQAFRGRTLLAQVIERFAPQTDALLLNANHQASDYTGFGLPLVADVRPGYAGPLAGLEAGLLACATPLLACVPCDSPFLPDDLVARLWRALEARQAEVAVAFAGGQAHHAFMLCRRDVQPGLSTFLDADGRRIGAWLAGRKVAEVAFDDADAFTNINTLDELKNLETP